MIGSATRVSTLVALGVFLFEVALLAASPQTLSRVGARFGPSKSQKHPKKVVLTQVVDRDFVGAKGDSRFCLTYSRSAENQPDKGSITATVELMRDDDSRKVGSISKTLVIGRRAESCTTEGLQLEAGDILVWTFKFKKMSKVPAGDRVDPSRELLAPGDPIEGFRLAGADVTSLDFFDSSEGFGSMPHPKGERRRASDLDGSDRQPTAQGAKEWKNHDLPTKFKVSTDSVPWGSSSGLRACVRWYLPAFACTRGRASG